MTNEPFDDDARELLARAVPPAPPVESWASQARARASRGRLGAGLLALVLILAIPTGIFVFAQRDDAAPLPGGAVPPPFVEVGTEVWGNAMIYQAGDEPEICFMTLDSYPPQCSGPTLRGAFSWDDLPHEDASGVKWTNEYYRVQGTFDPADGPEGSLTLTAALAEPEHQENSLIDFPQLCSDPLRGADPALTGDDAQAAIESVLAGFDVVNVWVSNGIDAYNVVVRGDAEEVHAALREVWGGELCVQSAPEPGGAAGSARVENSTEAERIAVVEKIFETLGYPPMLGGGPSGTESRIELDLLYLDRAAYDAIREISAGIPVKITTALTPLGASSSVAITS